MAKLTVTMKDPDCLYEPVEELVRSEVKAMGLTDADEIEAVESSRRERYHNKLRTWFECGEYLELEIDLEAMTITVKYAE